MMSRKEMEMVEEMVVELTEIVDTATVAIQMAESRINELRVTNIILGCLFVVAMLTAFGINHQSNKRWEARQSEYTMLESQYRGAMEDYDMCMAGQL